MGSAAEDNKEIDGVVVCKYLRRAAKRVSLYSQFHILPDKDSYEPFEVGKVYDVVTIGTQGFARLEAVMSYDASKECYCLFRLFHYPENATTGRLPRRFKENELVLFHEIIRIRSRNVKDWLSHYSPRDMRNAVIRDSVTKPSSAGITRKHEEQIAGAVVTGEKDITITPGAEQRLSEQSDKILGEEAKTSKRMSLSLPLKIISAVEYCYLNECLSTTRKHESWSSELLEEWRKGKKICFTRCTFQDEALSGFHLFQTEKQRISKLPMSTYFPETYQGEQDKDTEIKIRDDYCNVSPINKTNTADIDKKFLGKEVSLPISTYNGNETNEDEPPSKKKLRLLRDVIDSLPLTSAEKTQYYCEILKAAKEVFEKKE